MYFMAKSCIHKYGHLKTIKMCHICTVITGQYQIPQNSAKTKKFRGNWQIPQLGSKFRMPRKTVVPIDDLLWQYLQKPTAFQKRVESVSEAMGMLDIRHHTAQDAPAAKKRCYLCPRDADWKVRQNCTMCGNHTCTDHCTLSGICDKSGLAGFCQTAEKMFISIFAGTVEKNC